MYRLDTLKNGLKLVTVPMKGTKTATVLVVVGTGSKYEQSQQAGLSHFVEHMFFKGTKRFPNTLALSGKLDSLGAVFNAFTGKEYTGYWVKTRGEQIEQAIGIVSDMLLNSKFSAREIEREKGVIIEEFNMSLDDPMTHIEDVFENLLYGDTPAGRDTIGRRETIRSFKRSDFIGYVKAQYGVDNLIVVLAGNVPGSRQGMKRMVENHFSSSDFNKRGHDFREKEAVREEQKRPQVRLEYKQSDQAHIALGVRSFAYGHEDRLTAKLMGIILGGSMSSRLFISLRERQGLAYYVFTRPEHYTDTGYLVTRAGVPIDKVDMAISTILKEYKRLKKSLVAKTELNRIFDSLSGRTAIQFESSDAVADWYGRNFTMETGVNRVKGETGSLNLPAPEEVLKKLKKISRQKIRRAANEIFTPDRLNLAVIGPYRDSKKFEKMLII